MMKMKTVQNCHSMPLINDQIEDILQSYLLVFWTFPAQMETETNLIQPNLAHHPDDAEKD